MTCTESNALIHAYLDNELDTTASLALLEHARTCAACRSKLEEFAEVKNTVSKIPPYPIPNALRRQVLVHVQPKKKFRWPSFRWTVPLVTGLALGVLAATILLPRPASDTTETNDIVWNHIHALKNGHLIDVVSSDKHTVKPWFAGKTDFSPLVIDLAPNGFPLLGARAESFAGHDAAALLYTNGKHYLSLYEWPVCDDPTGKDEIATIRGYHSSTFNGGEMRCCVVSDASPEEVGRFQRTLLAAVASKKDE